MASDRMQLGECPTFTRAEERVLWERMRGGDADARKQLILSCAPWAMTYVQRFNLPWWMRDDAPGIAMLGLIAAVDSFDARRGKLTTLVSYYVFRDIKVARAHDGLIRIPKSTAYPSKKQPPSEKTLAAYEQWQNGLVNLDAHDYYRDLIAGREPNPADVAAESIDLAEQLAEVKRAARKVLTERNREVIERRCNGETLKEIGKRMGLSRERIRQIEHQSYCRIRNECGVTPRARVAKRAEIVY